jgi:uroporphyrinogen III methyltransferase/synthase
VDPTTPTATGLVTLVGAGPGDPDLLTLAGQKALAAADVVVYDALAPVALLAHAPDARHVYAGKRAQHHSMTQDEINRLLVDEAKAGHRVVRLKGGDPFIFGRGGEEAEACIDAGVRFEVVPGITAAVAAAAYAGIPVTHRDLNTSLTLVTGHEKDKARQSPEAAARDEAGSDATDWQAMARLPLLCVYMGVKKLGDLSAKLIDHGKSPDTPAASVQWGTTPRQKTVVATLGTIADEIRKQGLGSPAITYVGEVVRLRESLRWFDTRPLFGKTVVVTRTRQQASDLSAKLTARGAEVVEAPTIEIVPPADHREVDEALRGASFQLASDSQRQAGSSPYVVFTSANGVAKTRERMDAIGLDARIFAGTKVAAVGPATAAACRDFLAIRPDVVPDRFDADELADALGDVAGNVVTLLRADIGRQSLVDTLRDRGAIVRDVAVYETKPASSLPDAVLARLPDADAITFTSGSTARNFAKLADVPEDAKLVSIGPQTSAAMREAGLTVAAEAEQATLDALVEATVAALDT